MEYKLPKPPARSEQLKWLQLAQHYGLPTRLLDWTQNAAVALYFVCCADLNNDGLVVVLNPIDLNSAVSPHNPRIFDGEADADVIAPYLKCDGKPKPRGTHTIAVNPTWNTERIILQQGFFTLHGSRNFELDRHQASSLLYVPILQEHKVTLRQELERVGIGEMFIFPEPEHVCSHLKRNAGL